MATRGVVGYPHPSGAALVSRGVAAGPPLAVPRGSFRWLVLTAASLSWAMGGLATHAGFRVKRADRLLDLEQTTSRAAPGKGEAPGFLSQSPGSLPHRRGRGVRDRVPNPWEDLPSTGLVAAPVDAPGDLPGIPIWTNAKALLLDRLPSPFSGALDVPRDHAGPEPVREGRRQQPRVGPWVRTEAGASIRCGSTVHLAQPEVLHTRPVTAGPMSYSKN